MATPESGDSQLDDLLSRLAPKEALASLFERYRDRLKAFLLKKLGTRLKRHVDLDDLAQEVYVRAELRLGRYLATRPIPAYAWLRRLARDVVIEQLRKPEGADLSLDERDDVSTAALQHGLILATDTSPTERARFKELRKKLLEAMGRLTPVENELLCCRFLDQLPVHEIAQDFDLIPNTATKKIISALRKLKRLLEAEGFDFSSLEPS